METYPIGICGSPDYVAQYRQPQHPDELGEHVCLNFRNRDTGRLYPWAFDVAGERKTYSVSGTVVLDNADAVGAIAGLDLSQMPLYLAKEAISAGTLIELLRHYRPPEIPIWICYLDRRFVAPRIRAFVEFMMDQKETFAEKYAV